MDKAYISTHKAYTLSVLEQIFPKVRAEIIRLLFGDSERQLHLRDLARLSGLAVGTVQREVAKMREIELIKEYRDGNRLYFRANREHSIYSELQSIALKTTGLKPQLSNAFRDLAGVDLAFVYGSFAKGSPTSDSDIDLFIIGSIGLRKLAPALRTVANKMNREINPTVMSLESFREKYVNENVYVRNVAESKKLWIIGAEDELTTVV
ncbi:MAG: nucleotidyltransferase domain-containing protein [Opitutales bacterium]